MQVNTYVGRLEFKHSSHEKKGIFVILCVKFSVSAALMRVWITCLHEVVLVSEAEVCI